MSNAKVIGCTSARSIRDRFRILDLSDPTDPQLLNTLEFKSGIRDLYVSEGTLTVITDQVDLNGRVRVGMTVHAIDVADPTQPVNLYQTSIEGGYATSRVIGDHLYVVSHPMPSPHLPAPYELVPSENDDCFSAAVCRAVA